MATDADAARAADRVVVSYRAAAVDGDTAAVDGDGAAVNEDAVAVDDDAAAVDGDGAHDGFAADHLVHERIHERPFRAYLRRVHGGPVTEGDEWAEFVNCGCGTTTDVVLRVEAVDGGGRLGEQTALDLVPFGADCDAATD